MTVTLREPKSSVERAKHPVREKKNTRIDAVGKIRKVSYFL